MTGQGFFVLAVIIIMIFALAKEVMRPGLILFSAAIIMLIFGSISPDEMLAGFSNKGMLTVGILFIVSEGIRQSGALNQLAYSFLPKKRGNVRLLFFRMMFPISFISAFLNNTPIVIIFAPIVKKWAESLNMSSQKFLIPLSYATILGGICTLIGTSTNLVVHGLMLENGFAGFSMFELGQVGVILAFVGYIYMSYVGVHLLPGEKNFIRKPLSEQKDYYYELVVPPTSSLIGQTLKNGRSKELKGFDIIEIERNGGKISGKEPGLTFEAHDQLLVGGKSDGLEMIKELTSVRLKGLDLLKDQINTTELKQYEAVLAPRFPGIGKTIVEFNFFEHYQAAIIAVHRNGERITSDLRNLRLKEGDNLVLLTTDRFIKNWGDSKIFYLTTYIGDHKQNNGKSKRWLALSILFLMIAGATAADYLPKFGNVKTDMFYFSAIAAMLMVWLKIVPHQKYTKAISWDILITIACSFGISKAMQNSGAADGIALTAINFAKSWGPVGVLACIYLITNIFTEVITNNAAAAVSFPIAMAAANQMGIDPKPFFVAICIAASASFTTPIGYQTNLIVQGIGNYRFKDFVKVGLPLNIVIFIVSILLIPFFWKF
ncbi:MAG TPA: SLC13 family permease [Prolixibacteraceae bacterium]|nr:SLC13 family permease [Prolixibacteraceae bacterium]